MERLSNKQLMGLIMFNCYNMVVNSSSQLFGTHGDPLTQEQHGKQINNYMHIYLTAI